LCEGVEPKRIAAITFTEFAASEILERIERFSTLLSRGEIPRDVAQAFPNGLTVQQKRNLEHTRSNLDQLTCTTIHGFAQTLIKPYPAEASTDPGAEIVDPAEADLAFQERYESWLKRKLSNEDADGIVAELVLADQGRSLALIGELAQFLRHNRNVRVGGNARWSNQLAKQFSAAVKEFETKLKRLEFREHQTAKACRVFAELARSLSSLATAKPSNRVLIDAIIFERNEACFTQSGNRRQLRTKGKWREDAAEKGRSSSMGIRLMTQ
jgi:ATP-dependent exoDNAse (exonuclease V) beta subunit